MRKILIIEKVEACRILLGELLKREGYEVFFAAGYDELHPLITKHNFDLILLTTRKGDAEGEVICLHIQENMPATRIIAVTADVIGFKKHDALELGCVDYLTKPLVKDKFKEVMQGLWS